MQSFYSLLPIYLIHGIQAFASEMTYIVSGGALISTHSLTPSANSGTAELLRSGILSLYIINVKQTTVYTHVNGDGPSHIENSKNKKSYITISLHTVVRQCAAV